MLDDIQKYNRWLQIMVTHVMDKSMEAKVTTCPGMPGTVLVWEPLPQVPNGSRSFRSCENGFNLFACAEVSKQKQFWHQKYQATHITYLPTPKGASNIA